MTDWYDRAVRRLRDNDFAILRPDRSERNPFPLVAHRSGFEITKFGNYEQFFIFEEFDKVSFRVMEDFSADAYDYAIRNKRSSLPCGFFEFVCCYAVAVARDASNSTLRAVRETQPPKHWASVEVPVVWMPEEGELAYLENTPLWGAAYWSGLRAQVENILGGIRVRPDRVRDEGRSIE